MKIKLNKLAVVERHLKTAIGLYFGGGDPVSIHTLVAAAYTILKDVNKDRGGRPMIKDMFAIYADPSFKKELFEAINRPDNFFKHADTDATEEIEFQPALTEILLWECCEKFQELAGRIFPEVLVYRGWFYTWGPIVDRSKISVKGIEAFTKEIVTRYTVEQRQPYYEKYVSLANELKATGRI